jgi:uncharacterized protein (DUF1800 family)
VFRRLLHDPGEKTVLGRTGRFDGDEVLDLLLARPETAEHVVAKLWREFVSPVPDAPGAPHATEFRRADYDIRVPVRCCSPRMPSTSRPIVPPWSKSPIVCWSEPATVRFRGG